MKTVYLALLASILGAGCANKNTITLLERDLRLQEDEIYRLQCVIDQCEQAHEATLRENDALKKEMATGDRGAGSDRGGSDSRAPAATTAPAVELPRSRTEEPKLEAPQIELPEGSAEPPVEITPGAKDGAAIEGTPTQLVINKQLTGGLDRDGHDGDEGLLVVVEPRDAANHLVNALGPVSIVVMDPTQAGDAARVARWDFAAEEVQSRFRTTVFGQGMQFELPWPGDPPKNKDLRLYVRFISDDGAKLNAELPIRVKPPLMESRDNRQTRSWSPSEGSDPPASQAPNSRLKSPAARPMPPRALHERPGRDSADAREKVEDKAAVEQASRPAWKPFR